MPTPPPWWSETQVAPAGGVEQGVEQGPVADRVAAVLHRLGLAVGRGDRAAVEMVAADDDRRRDFAVPDHLVEGEAEAVALAEADPADPRGQALEGDPLARHVEPAVEVRIVGDQFLHLGVGLGRCPRDRPTARPSGTGRCRGRRAGGHRRGRSRGSRRRG